MEVDTTGGSITDDCSTATVDDVDILRELDCRPARPPDYEAQNAALARLAEEMHVNPRNMLQRLVEVVADVCRADMSGISLLEGDVFRWEAIAGVFAGARDGNIPRHASPGGVVIDRDAIQLMEFPDRCFPALPAVPRVVEALLFPFHDHGSPIGTVWVVSHRPARRFDREDARIVTLLTEYVSAAWQLWRVGDKAVDESRRKDEFLATLSHELRNPFAAITAAVSMLEKRVSADAPERSSVDVIMRQSQIIARLVDDLLDVSRIENGKLALNKQTVDLREIVSQSIEMRRATLAERRHEVTLYLAPAAILVDADPVRITQIVVNLVDNAVKYTPEGGQIRVSVAETDSHGELVIEDNGDGIPADRIAEIFDPFTQLQPATNGLGLGLAIVRRLTELHGGSIHVISDGVGTGSRFVVRLPMHVSGRAAVA